MLGHKGYYLCSGPLVFRDCPRGQEHRSLHCMRFNMHCHQPELYFKIDHSGINQGPSQGHFNQNNVSLSADNNYKQQNKRVKFDQYQHGEGMGRGNNQTLPA